MPLTSVLRIAPLAIVAMLSVACSSNPPAPPMAPVAADTNPGNRLLRPGDVIKVQVFGHNELSGEFPIDENFNLLLPIVGEFSVQGMPVRELREKIRRDFGQLYTQSFITVVPLFRVSVLGEVMHPGLFSVDPTMTIYEVIAMAGGSTRNARESKIRLIRAGQTVPLPITSEALARATIREIGVRSGDQVYVPRKAITYETWLVGLQLLNTALLAYTIFK